MKKKILDVPVLSSAPSLKKSRSHLAEKSSSANRIKYTDMITSAVRALKKPKGSTRQAIAKYVQNNYAVAPTHVNRNVTKNLREMVSKEQLAIASGTGAAGRFKLTKKSNSSLAVTKKRKPKKPIRSPKKKVMKKANKRKTTAKKKVAKRTTKKPSKPSKRTTSKSRPKKPRSRK